MYIKALEKKLIDEICGSHEEALQKSIEKAALFAKIDGIARHKTKLLLRHDTIQYMTQNFEAEVEKFVNDVQSTVVQNNLQKYVDNLKKRKN